MFIVITINIIIKRQLINEILFFCGTDISQYPAISNYTYTNISNSSYETEIKFMIYQVLPIGSSKNTADTNDK